MKKTFFSLLVMAAAMICFTGCMKSNTESGDSVLYVYLPGGDPNGTKAIEAQVADATVATLAGTDNVEVFLLAGPSVVRQESFLTGEITQKWKVITDVASTVNNVVIFAKIPAADLAAVKALTTYNALMDYAYTVASQHATTGINDKTIWGQGTPQSLTTPTSPITGTYDNYKEVIIDLNSLTARFEIGAIYGGTGIASIVLDGVFINYYYEDGKQITRNVIQNNMGDAVFFVNPPVGGLSLTHDSPRSTAFSPAAFTTPYTEPVYYNMANNTSGSGVTQVAGSNVYAFHVFAGPNIPHVLMLVHGEYDTGYYSDDDKYFCGWVTFTKYNLGGALGYVTAIQPNMIYKMGVGATGIEINAEDITPDPELEDFDLGIIVQVTKWTAVNVTPEV